MTPKHYTQNAALIQWAYLFEEFRPLKTDTCALFWRSVVLTPVKLLLPILGVLFLLFLTMSALLPEWLPVAIRPERRQPGATPSPLPLAIFLLVVACAAAVGGVFVALNTLGVCKPVEIEGGLVRKGTCPSLRCYGAMVETSETIWTCRRCGGSFTPAS